MTTLAPADVAGTYEFLVTDALHDPTFNRWSQTQIDTYINIARKQLVMDTGCLRSLQSVYLTRGKEQYIFGQVTGAGITNGGQGYTHPTVTFSGGGGSGAAATLVTSGGVITDINWQSFGNGYTSAPIATISDPTGVNALIDVGVLSSQTFDILGVQPLWGNQRYSLDWYPWRDFSSMFRQWTSSAYQRQPVAWAAYGDNSVFIGPPPDQSYSVEMDTIVLPIPLAVGDETTQDDIPAMAQDPIPFYAAYLAKKNAQNLGEAEAHLNDYRRRMLEVTSAYTGRIKSQYGKGC